MDIKTKIALEKICPTSGANSTSWPTFLPHRISSMRFLTTDHSLHERSTLSFELGNSPYDADLYLQRALCHEKLGYPDLAASDAYRALLLTDELLDEEGEYHEQALHVLEVGRRMEEGLAINGEVTNGMNGHSARDISDEKAKGLGIQIDGDDLNGEDQEPWYDEVVKGYASRSYELLARTLAECGDLKTAYEFLERGLRVFPCVERLQKQWEQGLGKNRKRQLQQDPAWDDGPPFIPREGLPENGAARREIYPWNDHEPDRFSKETLSIINTECKKYSPKCEIRAVQLPILDSSNSSKPSQTIKQLGIFATTPIAPHETVLLEPSVITSSTRLHDPFCDACSSRLPPYSPDSPLPACPDCEDTLFCSQACSDRAQSLYHPAICGIIDYDVVVKDPPPFAATNALYTLLIARTMAMAETQNIHPLDLPQIKYLWGDFIASAAGSAPTLPFNFENNIQAPLHLLNSLSLDLFVPSTVARYDTWVINTLLSKFRGVANAKMNERTGIPEVAGVHWLWSMANHSCAPNVLWEWEKGGMGFVARGGDEVVRWGEKRNEDEAWKGGIGEGEEVMNHYCDVELPVRARREWAVGALGGVCVCRRCVWEEGEEAGREKLEDRKGET